MKSNDELQKLKKIYEELNNKLLELSQEEIEYVVGGKVSEEELHPHSSGDDVC